MHSTDIHAGIPQNFDILVHKKVIVKYTIKWTQCSD